MLDMQKIGYYQFMEQQEKKRAEQQKVNVKSNSDFKREQATQNEKRDKKI